MKYYATERNEGGCRVVREIINDAKQRKRKLISSLLLVGEVVSAFDKWRRQKKITPLEFDLMVSTFLADIQYLLAIDALAFEGIILSDVLSTLPYIIRHHLPTNDALHLYTAVQYAPSPVVFCSADKSLLCAAAQEGLAVLNLEERRCQNL